jgi:hypothetical protein
MRSQQAGPTTYDNIHLIVYVRYFVIDGMRETQDLCGRHSSFLLGQSI